jgi:CheY-like chemotaxis protein
MTTAVRGDAPCVLIVDDEPSICETLTELVEMTGCVAVCAANGEEALKLLEAPPHPRLIILDLMMPVMDGADFLRAMRSERRLDAVPVVISTSVPEQAPAGVPVLVKPVEVARVFEWISRCCGCPVPS